VRPWLQWTLAILTAAIVDLAARIALPFDLRRVLLVETFLFPATGLLLGRLAIRSPARRGWRRTLQWVAVAAFVLAGLRSGLWVAGAPVTIANGVVLAAAVAAWLVARRRTRERSRP
jgi:hypothetical protein